ncbi:MAG: protein disulfide oxidoreductase [Neisseria sp.]|uniref:protein disulfide oxidoreductase n=1 Tax=Neisseria sp. TaxID=192066 RepID=UPI0026DDA1FF|nr:protein disulfide oxidoreductase [Neisseria sp.]MDO4641474.1 protein disulfide oxidoreductase [Neisseria sp.]
MNPPKWRRWLQESAKLAVLILIIFSAVNWWRKPSLPEHFSQQPLQTLSQKTVNLAQLSQNKVAVLYFWGTWCGYCKRTSPVVEQLRAEGIPVLSIALSSGDDEKVSRYMQEHGLRFETVNDPDGALSKQWEIAVTPTVVFLKNGAVSGHTTGRSGYWDLRMHLLLADWF